jgi:hypothetical protein
VAALVNALVLVMAAAVAAVADAAGSPEVADQAVLLLPPACAALLLSSHAPPCTHNEINTNSMQSSACNVCSIANLKQQIIMHRQRMWVAVQQHKPHTLRCSLPGWHSY